VRPIAGNAGSGDRGVYLASLATYTRRVGPADLQVAKRNLRKAAEGAVTDVRDDVVNVVQTALNGLTAGALLAPVQQAANIALNQLMVMVSEAASFLLRRAAGLVVQDIDKVLIAPGKAQDAARKQAARSIQDLQKDSVFANLLDRLCDMGRIQEAVNQEIDNGPETLGPDPFNTASMRVTQLATKFRKQKQVVALLLRGLAFATRAWLLPSTPDGPLALATGYVSAVGYVVYAGGDYGNWFRIYDSERLDFVPGVRSVRRSVQVPRNEFAAYSSNF
jgi:hypothetical protein